MAIADSSPGESAASGTLVGVSVAGIVAVGATSTGWRAAPGTWISSLPAPRAAAVAKSTVNAATRISNRQGERRWSRGNMPAIGKALALGRLGGFEGTRTTRSGG